MNLLEKNPDAWSTKYVEDMHLIDKNVDGWSTDYVESFFDSNDDQEFNFTNYVSDEEYDPTKQMFLWEKYEYDT